MRRNPDRCRIYIDLPRATKRGPKPGDYIMTQGVRGWGSAYQAVEVVEAKRRDPKAPRRFHMVCLRAGVGEVAGSTWVMKWYRREGKKRKGAV